MTRVLLTGAGGFVGHHTLEHILTTTDWEVVCTDSFKHAGKIDRITEVLEGYSKTTQDRVSVVTQDLTVPFSPQTAQKIGHIDAIISMASESHVDRSISEPVDFIHNNVSLVLNLLEYAKTYAPEALFLQVSTDEVYGPAPAGHNHGEWEPNYPSNPYSASKSSQDAIAFSYWRTYGVPLISTHTMNIIGERQDPEKFVPMVIQKIAKGEKVSIHASPEGVPGSRYYLHARNQADALVFLLKKAFDGELDDNGSGDALRYVDGSVRPPKFHIVGEREVSNLEMAFLVADHVGENLDYELVSFHASRPGHDLRYALDGSKLAELGWTPPVPFEESLKTTVDWSLKNRVWLL